MLGRFFEQESADQVNSGEKDERQNCATEDGEDRVGQFKVRTHDRNGRVRREKAARISHDNRNHANQLPDETESPAVNDFQQQNNNG